MANRITCHCHFVQLFSCSYRLGTGYHTSCVDHNSYDLFADLLSGEGEAEYGGDSVMRIGDTKSGQNLGTEVTCQRWTSRLVTVGRSNSEPEDLLN